MQCYTEANKGQGVVYYGYGKTGHDQMRRADRAISREDALAVIDRCAYGTLSLIATDGTPYAVALNVVRDGKKLFFHSAPEGD